MRTFVIWYGRIEGSLGHGARFFKFQRAEDATCLRVGRYLIVVSSHITRGAEDPCTSKITAGKSTSAQTPCCAHGGRG